MKMKINDEYIDLSSFNLSGGICAANVTINGKEIIVNGRNIKISVKDEIVVKIEGGLANLTTDNRVECGDIHGNLEAHGPVKCNNIGKNLIAHGPVNCGSVGGDVIASGPVNMSKG